MIVATNQGQEQSHYSSHFLDCNENLTGVKTQEDGTRHYHYLNSSGEELALGSVTTILQGSASQADAISLVNAKKKWDKQYEKGKKELSWDEHCENARNRGTTIHSITENILKKNPYEHLEIPDSFEESIQQIKLKAMGCKLLASEFFVYNKNSNTPYGGRADLYVKMYGLKYLIDIKTSASPKELYQWNYNRETKKRRKGMASWYERAIIQLTAYQLAMESWEESPDAIGIWLITPEGLDQYTIDIPKDERVKWWNDRVDTYVQRLKSSKK